MRLGKGLKQRCPAQQSHKECQQEQRQSWLLVAKHLGHIWESHVVAEGMGHKWCDKVACPQEQVDRVGPEDSCVCKLEHRLHNSQLYIVCPSQPFDEVMEMRDAKEQRTDDNSSSVAQARHQNGKHAGTKSELFRKRCHNMVPEPDEVPQVQVPVARFHVKAPDSVKIVQY